MATWGSYRPAQFGPRIGELGSQPYQPTGGYGYDTLTALQGGGMPGAQVPFAANGPGQMPFGSGGGWQPPPPNFSNLPAPPSAPGGNPLGGLMGSFRGGTPLSNVGPSAPGAISGIAGPLLYGFGQNFGPSIGRDTNNPLGRTLGSTLKGAGGTLTATGNPVFATLGGLQSAATQQGYETGKGNNSKDWKSKLATSWLESNPLTGAPTIAGDVMGALSSATGQDWIKPSGIAEGIMSHIPGLGGGDKGGEQAAAAPAEKPAGPNITPEGMTAITQRLGINGDYSAALVSDFNNTVNLGLVNSENNVPTQVPTDAKGQYLDADGKVVKDPKVDPTTGEPNFVMQSRVLTPDEVKQQAYGQFLQSLPAIQAQQQQDAEYSRRTASMQAAIADYIPQVAAPGTAALQSLGTQLLGSIPGLSPGMQQAATNYATTSLNSADTYNQALANSLAFLPQQYAQQQNDQYQSQYASQLQAAQIQNQLAQQYPEMFAPRKGANAASSSGGISLDQAITGQG